MTSPNRICHIEIDEKGLAAPTREIEQERRVAIFDLLEENSFGLPARPEQLRGHDCLHYGYLAGGSDWSLQRDGEPSVEVPVHGRLCSNNGEALQQAALGDGGIALLPRFVVEDDLAAGRLVEVLPDWRAPAIAAHALYARTPRTAAKVRAFVEHLVATLASSG